MEPTVCDRRKEPLYVRMASWVRDIPPKIGGYGWGISLPKSEPRVEGQPNQPMPDIGQEKGMKPQAPMR